MRMREKYGKVELRRTRVDIRGEGGGGTGRQQTGKS